MIELAIMLAAQLVPGFGTFETGNVLWEDCSSPKADYQRQAWCGGYVSGVVDMNAVAAVRRGSPVFCLPAHVTVQQAIDVVRKFLEDHPEKRHAAAADMVAEALSRGFPCKK